MVFFGLFKARMEVVVARITTATKIVVINPGVNGNGIRRLLRRFTPRNDNKLSFAPRNDNLGWKIDRAITAGRSIANSVIHGLIFTEPKQPQESAPVRPL